MPPGDKKPHAFKFLGKAIASGLRGLSRHGKTAAPASQIPPDSGSESFDELLQRATPAKLLSLIRCVELPSMLTTKQVDRLRLLLGSYHEDALTSSPIIDVPGNPIPLKRDKEATESNAWSHTFNEVVAQIKRSLGLKEKLRLASDVSHDALLRRVDQILENYPSHKAWLRKYLKIRTVEPEGVCSSNMGIVGQEGVFAAHDIPAGISAAC